MRTGEKNIPTTDILCDTCPKNFEEYHVLKKHVRDTHGTKRHECGKCSKVFTYKCELKSHMLVHKGKKLYKCLHRQCGNEYTTIKALNQHMKKHAGAVYSCRKCTFTTDHPQHLRQHEKVHQPKMHCHCGFPYIWNSQLQNHRQAGCPELTH